MRPLLALFALTLPSAALADGLTVDAATVPLAPPTARAHAAYVTLTNTGSETRSLTGVSAPGYMMVHLHQSAETDGIVTMTPVDQLDIPPGTTLTMARGGLHIMLMRPETPLAEGGEVPLTLEFANGDTLSVIATVVPLGHGS